MLSLQMALMGVMLCSENQSKELLPVYHAGQLNSLFWAVGFKAKLELGCLKDSLRARQEQSDYSSAGGSSIQLL